MMGGTPGSSQYFYTSYMTLWHFELVVNNNTNLIYKMYSCLLQIVISMAHLHIPWMFLSWAIMDWDLSFHLARPTFISTWELNFKPTFIKKKNPLFLTWTKLKSWIDSTSIKEIKFFQNMILKFLYKWNQKPNHLTFNMQITT